MTDIDSDSGGRRRRRRGGGGQGKKWLKNGNFERWLFEIFPVKIVYRDKGMQ